MIKSTVPPCFFQITEEQSMDYSFRELTEKDNKAVAYLVRSSLEKVGLDIPGTAYFDERLDRFSELYGTDRARYYVLTDENGRVAGGIGFSEFAPMEATAELQKLYLDDADKGAGLGYRMVDFVEGKMREAGFKYSYLETHDRLEAAIHIYIKSGYREIERPAAVGHSAMTRFFIKDLRDEK